MPPKSRDCYENRNNEDDEPSYSSAVAKSTPIKSITKGKGKASHTRSAIPDVFHDLLAETLSSHEPEVLDVPRKRRKFQDSESFDPAVAPPENVEGIAQSDDDDDVSLDFEDVLSPKPKQTAHNNYSGESDDSDLEWEIVAQTSSVLIGNPEDGDLVLTLNKDDNPKRKPVLTRRKALTKIERVFRLDVHKMNLLCLLRFVDRRNDWCNDIQARDFLKPLLTKKIMEYFRPKESNTQLGKAESIKKGISLACDIWEARFTITARGMRRPFWVFDEKELSDFKLSTDFDPPLDRGEFRIAAKKLQGSRDVGAQLFCALLRSAGLETRLVCSLQPLPFTAANKAVQGRIISSPPLQREPSPEINGEDLVEMYREPLPSAFGGANVPGMPFTPQRRLGHPNAANYFMPQINSPSHNPKLKSKPKRKFIVESPYPIFWVEVLDKAHQKWMPVNPFEKASISKPSFFEPPASDPDNNISYIVGFEDEGTARDITRRYTQSYNAKIRRNRVESTDGGERWWKRTLRYYSRGWKNDLDQIEDTELAAKEAREPMPKGIADFKDHPTYALERHLRRNEILVNAREIGKVAAGRDSNGKKLEKVYRRSDVKTVKSADGWYRIGREVKVGEQPVKVIAAKTEDEDDSGTSLYTESQTEMFEAPPVVRGRIPKNSYGNLDVYVPSMVPKGGVHIQDPSASRAARLLGVDYADAVTGFEFKGRHGTAIVKGIVAATEYKEAIEAVLEGYQDEKARVEEEMRSLNALRTWKRFLISLRIKERVDGYQLEGEEDNATQKVSDEDEGPKTSEEDVPRDDDSGMESEEYFDDGGGGFFPE